MMFSLFKSLFRGKEKVHKDECDFHRVKSTRKTIYEVIKDSGLIGEKGIRVTKMIENGEGIEDLRYRGEFIWGIGNPNKYVTNSVCIVHGECDNKHKEIIDVVLADMERIDKEKEISELAEHIWSDNCKEDG